jgi:ubiquinone/menaquinone biosynthesis C-methylase UbiE
MDMSDTAGLSNFDLRDEIKAYWSERAKTFDQSPGHEIFSEDERAAWHSLFIKHLGSGNGRSALDLASGTGVVSHLMDDLGFRVTGMDWAEPMLERARAKAKARRRTIAFRLGDAENTMEPDGHYDVIVNRHLVWTLVDPAAAFAEWLRVLKPGGRLVIIDGDFVNPGLVARTHRSIRRKTADKSAKHAPPERSHGNPSQYSCAGAFLSRRKGRGCGRIAKTSRFHRYRHRYRYAHDTSNTGKELWFSEVAGAGNSTPLCGCWSEEIIIE